MANYIMEEFWQQGDDETSKGLTTLDNIEPILDRRQSVNLPSLEVSSTKEPLKPWVETRKPREVMYRELRSEVKGNSLRQSKRESI